MNMIVKDLHSFLSKKKKCDNQKHNEINIKARNEF